MSDNLIITSISEQVETVVNETTETITLVSEVTQGPPGIRGVKGDKGDKGEACGLFFRALSTEGAEAELTSDGLEPNSSNRLFVKANSALLLSQIDLVAYDPVNETGAAWKISDILVVRGDETRSATIVGTPNITVIQSNMTFAPTVTVGINSAFSSLAIKVRPGTTDSTHYVAIVRALETSI